MVDPVAETLAWYDQRAGNFAALTADLDLAPIYRRFLRHVRQGGKILDAGCGVGRDALAFADQGFAVTAFDASTEMVNLAQARVGNKATVRLLRFEDVDWHDEFDGIWACASLLHVPQAAFGGVALRLAAALRPNGACYMSFKLGRGERIKEGRLFVDHTEATLRDALRDVPVQILDGWITEDVRAGQAGEQWINVVALRH